MVDSPLLIGYQNGNYSVFLYEDGTKERMTKEDEFLPLFPESIDLKITNQCDLLCPMCHEQSLPTGIHGDLDASFLYSLPPGIELAIGGGNPLSHPYLEDFLKRLKNKRIIPNLTINERHLLQEKERVKRLLDERLIYGLGVSLSCFEEETFRFLSPYHNAIYHLILGITTLEDIYRIPQGGKALFLGYKEFGRGKTYFSELVKDNISFMRDHFKWVIPQFSHIAFDNLALRQLEAKKHMPHPLYERYFMGEDGEFTMYIDLVKKEYAVSSTSSIRYPLEEDIETMFQKVRASKAE